MQEVSGWQARELRLPQNGKGPVTVRVWHEGDFRPEKSNQVTLNAATAAVVSVDRSANWSVGRCFETAPASIHYTELGIAPMLLFVSDFAIWWTGYWACRQTAQKPMQALLIAA